MDLIERYGENSDEIPSRADRLRQGAEVLRLQGAPPRRREARRVRHRRDLRPLLRPRHDRAVDREAAGARVGRRRPVQHLPDDREGGRDARRLRERRDPAVLGRCRLAARHRRAVLASPAVSGLRLARWIVAATLVALLSAVAAGCGGSSSSKSATGTSTGAASCAPDQLNLVKRGPADGRHRQPGLPALVRGRHAEELDVEDQRPGDAARATRRPSHTPSRSSSASRKRQVKWDVRAVQPARSRRARRRSTSTSTRSRSRPRARRSSTSATRTTTSNQALVVHQGTPIAKATTHRRPEAVQARRAARHDELRRTSSRHDQAVEAAGRLQQRERRRRPGAEEQADRRARRRPADGVLRHRPCRCRTRRSSASSRPSGGGEHFGMVFAKGNPLVDVRQPGARDAAGERHAEAAPAAVAGEGDRRAGPEVAAGERRPDLGAARGSWAT